MTEQEKKPDPPLEVETLKAKEIRCERLVMPNGFVMDCVDGSPHIWFNSPGGAIMSIASDVDGVGVWLRGSKQTGGHDFYFGVSNKAGAGVQVVSADGKNSVFVEADDLVRILQALTSERRDHA